jgi:hypothetical protein
MRTLMALAAAAVLTLPQCAHASGCFGGQPDIVPRSGSRRVPSNSRVTIARRAPAGVSWIDPSQRRVSFHERRVGSGPSAALVLTSHSPLAPGLHTLQTTDPDSTHMFTVVPAADSLPPRITGRLTLEAFHAPDPASECPETTFIRVSVPAPEDDRTETEDLTYFVWVTSPDAAVTPNPDLVLPAESVSQGRVFFRFGELDCGCIPRAKLEPGGQYRVTVRAVDAAGNVSANRLAATVTVPSGSRP